MVAFAIAITDQYWIDGSRESQDCPDDTTSHGKIKLIINDIDISGCDDEGTDYGLNQSAVRLLQTIFIDNSSGNLDNPIFFHGCSVLTTCPNCIIDFRVRHKENKNVVLDRFFVTGGGHRLDPNRYYNLTTELSNLEYARKVKEFSKEVYAFLPQAKKGEPAYEINAYENLRKELSALIDLTDEYLKTKTVNPTMKKRVLGFEVPWPISIGPTTK